MLALTFAACQKAEQSEVPTQTAEVTMPSATLHVKGDFSFTLPEGYAIAYITDLSCDIVDAQHRIAGGIEVTSLTAEDILGSDNQAFLRYLDFVAGADMHSEYVILDSTNNHILKYVSNQITDPETREAAKYTRFFTEKDGIVYDLWLDNCIVPSRDRELFQQGI